MAISVENPKKRRSRAMVLQTLRSKKFAKRVLIVLLILIIPAFVLWGAGNIMTRPGPVGKISGRKVSVEDFMESRQAVKTQILFAYYNDMDTLNKILQNRSLVNFMAWERLMLLDSLGRKDFKVTNDDVIYFITHHPLFQRNGVFDRNIYGYVLRNNLSTEPRQFEEFVRQNLRVRAFRHYLTKDVSVSDEELREAYRKSHDKVNISYFLIDKSTFSGEVAVTDEEARSFYAKNKDIFFEPEKVDVEYIEFPYASSDEKESVLRKIEKMYPELVRESSRFGEIAGSYGLRHGDTGPFSRDNVVPGITFFSGFQDAAFSLKEGEISSPVFSSPDKGVAYILRKTRIIPRKPLTFEEARKEITTTLKDEKCLELANRAAIGLFDEISTGGITFKEAAERARAEIRATGDIDINGYIENVGPSGEIVLLALDAGTGRVMPPVPTKKGAFLGRVERILHADEKVFESQKEEFRDDILSRKQMAVMDKWFKENRGKTKLYKPLEEF
jgi:peptidyl-prolyl cis-trans isomerase D